MQVFVLGYNVVNMTFERTGNQLVVIRILGNDVWMPASQTLVSLTDLTTIASQLLDFGS